ncbi:hypothetical protein IWW57_003574 [Coemansia sp. S610]|nr:hypothetical protein IWW57_003574 [Coemansia sp. S610]
MIMGKDYEGDDKVYEDNEDTEDVGTHDDSNLEGDMRAENVDDNNEEQAPGHEGPPDDYYCSDPSENEELDAAYSLAMN